MASSSTSGNEITRDWVKKLKHSSIMELREFSEYFYKPIQPEVDIVVIYENDNSQSGFGFVVNKESKHTGGNFRTVPDWADRLKKEITSFSNTMRNIHTAPPAQNDKLSFGAINYAQLKSPLNPTHLLQRQISNYFKNRPSCDFEVVVLFSDNRCGFGFVQIPPTHTENSNEINYLAELRFQVHRLMAIVDGGLTAICGNFSVQGESSFAPPVPIRPFLNPPSVPSSGSDSSRIRSSIQQQYNLPVWGATGNSVMQHQQPIPAMIPHEATNTPSDAHLWIDQLPSSGLHSGGEQNTNHWTGSANAAGMQQSQSLIRYPPTAAVVPYGATNTPSGAYMWSGQFPVSDRLSGGEQNASHWSRTRNAAAMQHPHPSVLYPHRPWMVSYEATNTPSSAYMWSGQFPMSDRLSGGEQNNTHWSGTRNAAAMQHPYPSVLFPPRHPMVPYEATNTPSGAYMWSGQFPVSDRLSGGEQNASHWSRTRNAAAMQHPHPSVLYPHRPWMVSYEATNTPSSAYMWSGQFPMSDRLSGGEQNNTHWSGTRNAAAMQHPYPSVLFPPRHPMVPYEATNTPSGAYMWSGQFPMSDSLSGGEQNTTHWSGTRNAAAMQHPHPSVPYEATNTPSGAYLGIGQATSTGMLSDGEENINQSPGSGNASVMQQQQQSDSFMHSRATTGANRPGQNRNA